MAGSKLSAARVNVFYLIHVTKTRWRLGVIGRVYTQEQNCTASHRVLQRLLAIHVYR